MPSLEHNNEVKGESLDLVKYIDSNFEGPALLPDVCILNHRERDTCKMAVHQFLGGINVCIHKLAGFCKEAVC